MMTKLFTVSILIMLICGLVLTAASCSSNSRPFETEADFTGFITEVLPGQAGNVTGRLAVESQAQKIVSKYVITVKNDTLIFREEGDDLHKAAITIFEPQQWVRIWFTGPVLESWPMQATAKQIVILK
jgi:hypothetical protein